MMRTGCERLLDVVYAGIWPMMRTGCERLLDNMPGRFPDP
jgi:hypothetical protein